MLILAHAAPSVRPLYPPDTHPFVASGDGMSSRYVALAARLRSGPLIKALLAHLGLGHREPLLVGGYSAGYALLRALAQDEASRPLIKGWLFIDGGHAGQDADGTAADREIQWLVSLVSEAAQGGAPVCYGYSDVDPLTYASTRETIDEAVRLAGVELTETLEACAGCASGQMRVRTVSKLRIEGHNHRTSAHDEHIQALREWGPALASRLVGMVPVCARMPLEVALSEFAAGVCETPAGSNTSPRIREYLAGCMRGGRRVGITSGSWCAAFASWCDVQAGLDTTPRAAVWELVEDARAAGLWREVGYVPRAGDLAVFKRGGDPRVRGQEGHVGRVERADGSTYWTIDGNVGDRVARVERRMGEEDLVGWIYYPCAPVPPGYHVATSDIAANAARLGLDLTARLLP